MNKNILMVVKIYNVQKIDIQEIMEIIEILKFYKCNIYMETKIKEINEYKTILNENLIFIDELNVNIDWCITYGGDGSILHANTYFYNKIINPPFFTINSGNLGFLCNFNWKNKTSQLELKNFFEENNCTLNKYKKLKIKINDKEYYILNEIVIEREDIKVINIDIFINDEEFIKSLICDGVLISSALGSTAYNSSINGNFLHAENNSFILNSISPFGINFKPLILSNEFKVKAKLNKSNYTKSRIVLDGIKKIDFNKGDEVTISLDNSVYQEIVQKRKNNNWLEKVKKFYQKIN